MADIPDEKEIAVEINGARECIMSFYNIWGENVPRLKTLMKDEYGSWSKYKDRVPAEIKKHYYDSGEIHLRFLLNTLDKFKNRVDNKKIKELKDKKKVIDDLLLQAIKEWNEFSKMMEKRKEENIKVSEFTQRGGSSIKNMRNAAKLMRELLNEIISIYIELGYLKE